MIRLAGLSKDFPAARALDGVDLDIRAGELLVVLGPTGAGKTTLLRCLAGLETPSAGRIYFDDDDATTWTPARRDVALVFQNFSLYPTKTVGENLAFPLRAPGRNLDRAAIAARVAQAAELLRIGHLLERKANRLSGGEMQRVALGRAIVREPRLFLLDEPLTNLDAKLREALRLELVALQRRLGRTLVHVTHDSAEALGMADRIAVLVGGRIRQVGTPEQIYQQPTDAVVARLLGQPPINLLTAAAPGMIVGIRPEHIVLHGGTQPARIRVVQDLGPQWVVVLDRGGQTLHAVVGKDQQPQVGATVCPSWPAEAELGPWPAS